MTWEPFVVAALLLVVWGAHEVARRVEAWWKAWWKRRSGAAGLVAAAVGFAAVGLSTVPVPSWPVAALAVTVVALVGALTAAVVGARRRGGVSGPVTPVGTPAVPRVVGVPGGKRGVYAVFYLNRDSRAPDSVKPGRGWIDTRVAAHTTASPLPRAIVARIPCENDDVVERIVLRDLDPWKIRDPLVPGEELFVWSPQVEAYLRALVDATAGATWEDRR